MHPRNILIHVVVAIAALHAAIAAAPAAAVMPVPAYAMRACEAGADATATYPGPYVAYPEGDVVFAAAAVAEAE